MLTKPLGIGIITTALKSEQVSQETIDRAIAVMSTLNRDAADAMLEVGVHAATDVTGFGLLGHLREMTKGSHVGAEIRVRDVPVMEEAARLVEKDVAPGGTRRNLQSVAPDVDFGGLPESDRLLLADAQTSGGLLIAVAPDRLDQLLKALISRGTPVAAHIGRCVEDPRGRINIAA